MSGALYDINNTKKIGANGVVVPSAFWKIIVDNNSKETLAFIFPHQEGLGSDLTKVQVTVAEVERVVGAPFSVPGDKNAKPALWPTFSKAMADEKKKICKG
jgi:DNA/RNA endonuclease G (NUC1)